MLSFAIGRKRFFQPFCVIFGLEDRVTCGRLTLLMIGEPASVVPEHMCPMNTLFFGSSAIFCATVPACFGSHASSSATTTNLRPPSTPPLAFHSSKASLMPLRYPCPSWATSPVSGPAHATWIGAVACWAVTVTATPSTRTRAARHQTTREVRHVRIFSPPLLWVRGVVARRRCGAPRVWAGERIAPPFSACMGQVGRILRRACADGQPGGPSRHPLFSTDDRRNL